jgi:hypothetical protein
VSCQFSHNRSPTLPVIVNVLRMVVVIADDVAAAS